MNKGTGRNILAQLDVSSDEYGMVTVLYTVSCFFLHHKCV